MSFREQRLSLEEARQIDMVDYLSHLGYEPGKITNNDYWYLSPLRIEKTPSFKINRRLNRWYDHGLGKGGNIIDFGILYHNCTVGEFLSKAIDKPSFQLLYCDNSQQNLESKPEPKILVVGVHPLKSFVLCRYLQQRKIPMEIAAHFCKEVKYELGGKEYFGIGFKNDSEGYEIRNPYFKASSSPKDITTFNNGAKEASVFEGFIDFLSYLTIHKNQANSLTNYVILNSVSFFEKARTFMEQHEQVRLYLDRDATGQNYSKYALSLSNKYKDESHLYKHYKDLNDWILNFGKAPKKNLRQRLR